ncbi:sodium-dependent nutrient amino acid transporter 1 [Amyelois transitella]|uniref:sodium-dependent nutrient amino acid transporter 1 n=1 Tax=Amyelois transitella TaxID=680683 RepID=UPI00067C95E6|nr:sodium-dependent nutrient amino acid transporter 1 [Amyelois transitella]
MIDPVRIKTLIRWPLVRAHLCSLAAALSFHSTWRVPRDGYRYGAVAYGLVLTAALMAVGLPGSLLQLAAGQLSQQDAVGVWRAVPFFKGVGYLRLLVSALGSIYTMVYVALLVTCFLYTANNSIPFVECREDIPVDEVGYVNLYNGTSCLNSTFLGPVSEQPEYFTAMALVILVLWTAFPFLLFNPTKMLKHILYPLGLVVFVLFVIVIAAIGDAQGLTDLSPKWGGLARPGLWFAAITQALWSSQVAGGYMISAGDTVYATTNVQWSALFMTGANIIASWCSLLFWGAVGGGHSDVTSAAVLIATYQVAEDSQLNQAWPLILFAALFLSGIITMLILLYPIYDRFRRVGGYKWRFLCIGFSLLGAAAAVATLAGRLPALELLEDTAAPILIIIATVLEVVAFVLVYGQKNLVEDIEFLIGRELPHVWKWGWYCVPVVIVPLGAWWVISELLDPRWVEAPWTAAGICASALLASLILMAFAAVAVLKQVQYDFCEKLQASFKASRHWGPRDPITHYYWLARRDELERGEGPSRYYRPQLGQLSLRSSFLRSEVASISKQLEVIAEAKRRSNSDDWLYTVYRKKQLYETYRELYSKSRSKSLDCACRENRASSDYFTPLNSLASLREDNNNVVFVKNLIIDK